MDLDGRLPTGFSLKSDSKGREILRHWLYGDGEDISIEDGDWGEYMKDDEILKDKTRDIVMEYANELANGESVEVDITTSMEIENGEDIIGYQYLHGTNMDAGGYHITGTITKTENGDVMLELTYTWNDIIDPNLMYSTDKWKSEFANWFANPQDYQIHITWHDKTIIYADGTSEGWLADENVTNDCEESGGGSR